MTCLKKTCLKLAAQISFLSLISFLSYSLSVAVFSPRFHRFSRIVGTLHAHATLKIWHASRLHRLRHFFPTMGKFFLTRQKVPCSRKIVSFFICFSMFLVVFEVGTAFAMLSSADNGTQKIQ